MTYIVGGDFNFECDSVDDNFGLSLFAEIVSDYKLICCDTYVFDGTYT